MAALIHGLRAVIALREGNKSNAMDELVKADFFINWHWGQSHPLHIRLNELIGDELSESGEFVDALKYYKAAERVAIEVFGAQNKRAVRCSEAIIRCEIASASNSYLAGPVFRHRVVLFLNSIDNDEREAKRAHLSELWA